MGEGMAVHQAHAGRGRMASRAARVWLNAVVSGQLRVVTKLPGAPRRIDGGERIVYARSEGVGSPRLGCVPHGRSP